ncbi:MAG: cytochrome c-type biogenesis protein [Wenzhouxiangellaceae bacterium]|nr:cytochrome c-type biogenesis protein [Wenzhouxiangellaceae bacterium]
MLFALILLLPAPVPAQDGTDNPIAPLEFRSETERARYHALIGELRCTVCQNQALASSDAPLAADLRRTVYRQIHAGRTDTEIRQFMRDRYGDFVLYNPPLAGHTLLLWAGPPLLLIIGGIAAVFIVARRRRMLARAD